MSNEDLVRQYQQGQVEGQLDFFTLEITRGSQDLTLRFHCNGLTKTISEDGTRYEPSSVMQWQGHEFTFVGMNIQGVQYSDGGRVNSPTLTVSNKIGDQEGYLGALCMLYNNLKGAKLTRHTTTVELYNANRNQFYTQVWYVERKTDHTAESLAFLLKSPLDFRKQLIPTRLVSPYCTWAMRGEYRGEVCGYTGTAYFDENGNPVDDILKDSCGGLCSDCELRFGKGNRLPHGGYLVTFDNGNW